MLFNLKRCLKMDLVFDIMSKGNPYLSSYNLIWAKEILIYHHRTEDCQAEQQRASNSFRQPASATLLVWILAYYVTCLIASCFNFPKFGRENHVTNTLTIFVTHDLSSVLWVPGYLEWWASSQFHPFWTCSFQSRCSWSCNFLFCDCRVWCLSKHNVGASRCHEGTERV